MTPIKSFQSSNARSQGRGSKVEKDVKDSKSSIFYFSLARTIVPDARRIIKNWENVRPRIGFRDLRKCAKLRRD